MSDLNATSVLNKIVSGISSQEGFAATDITTGIKDGSLITSVTDDAATDPHFFYNLFQASVNREFVDTTLGYVIDCLANQPGGVDGQFPLNEAKVNAIIADPTLGLCHLVPLLNDIELVATDVDGNPAVGGGRHRVAATIKLLDLLGFSVEQYRSQKLRVSLTTFTGDNAVANASLYILSSNNSRTMTPSEKSAVKMTAIAGVHYSDSFGVANAVRSGHITVAIGLGIIANNIAVENEDALFTTQAWSILAKSFVTGLSKEKTPLFYEDQTPVMTAKGDLPKLGNTYGKLLDAVNFDDLVDVFNDAIATAVGQVIMPTNVARDGVPLVSKVALQSLEDFDLNQFSPDPIARKVAKVRAVKPVTSVKTTASLTMEQCEAIARGEVESSLRVSDVNIVRRALTLLGGYAGQSLTVTEARAVMLGDAPITASQAQAIINGDAENTSKVSAAQLLTIAKSEQQAVVTTPIASL